MPPKNSILNPPKPTKTPSQISFHLYLRRYFHAVAKGFHYISRISKDAVDRLNSFLNDFIVHITRSGCKIARDDNRKTLLDRDIDDVFYILLEPSEYRGSRWTFNEALTYYKEFTDDPYHKKPATLGDKYYLIKISPTRVLQAMKQTEPDMRISELAVIRLGAFMNDMFGDVFRASMGRNVIRKTDGKTYTRTISWAPIRNILVDDIDYKISYCRFQL